MDSIPWEKAKLSEFGKKLSKWEQYEENLFSGSHAGKHVHRVQPLDQSFFIEGFSCFCKKQIYMDGEQMGELALIIWDPYMEM